MASIQDQHTCAPSQTARGTLSSTSRVPITTPVSILPVPEWVFKRADIFWFIKSVGSDQYLGILGDISTAQNSTRVIAVSFPFAWAVEDSDVSGA
ncbi:hypothetical protein AZE42_12215 [Rhizopogon vesiculosus]|uniref:Uncharacterized protein n=1 Tax=Rhizopogon vesiculosus TaxID=180088 RepID=A0A1J8PX42_9AGAM|nr:hypothetical protein AZE42_12215 [Rhizopogon vesiculosus]